MDFKKYLLEKKTKQKVHTHTRIGASGAGIYGGKYNIDDLKIFWKLYNHYVFVNEKKEYLTERQIPNGQLLIDLDFNYAPSVKERQHNDETIKDIINLYLEKLREIFIIPTGCPIKVWALEKPNVNCLENKTKDGLHIVIGIQMSKDLQLLLREKVLKDIDKILSGLPLQNTYEDVLDKGISKGTCNWQVYGSRKPNHEAYKIIKYYDVLWTDDDEIKRVPYDYINTEEILPIISARYEGALVFETHDNIKEQLIKFKAVANKKKKNTKIKRQAKQMMTANANMFCETKANPLKYYPEIYKQWWVNGLDKGTIDITNTTQSAGYILQAVNTKNEEIIEIAHGFLRPAKNYSEEWVNNIINSYDEETHKDYVCMGATLKWMINWCLNESCKSETEYDIAMTLYYVCYEDFMYNEVDNHIYHWTGRYWKKSDEKNSCHIISSKISIDLLNQFYRKQNEVLSKIVGIVDEKEREKMQNYVHKIAEVGLKCKKTSWKKNIEIEFKNIIKLKNRVKREQLNKEMGGIVFKNGVVSFNDGIKFGKGEHTKHNYNTFSLDYDYIPYNKDNEEMKKKSDVLKTLMKQVFPIHDVKKWMWELFALALLGRHKQFFIILKGTGGNGKGMIMNLINGVLGEYYYKASADILVDHKVDARGSNVEVAGMSYKRLVMYNELPKRKKFNCAKIKLLSGDKVVKARMNHSNDSKVIQYGLHMCDCNFFPSMDEEDTNQNAIKRRLRVVHTISKFCKNPSDNEDDYEFKADDYFTSDKFIEEYKGVFMAMLIEVLKRTKGEMKDCETITKWTEEYYKTSSDIEEFFKSIIKEDIGTKHGYNKMVSFKDLYTAFRDSPIYSTLTTYDRKKYNKTRLIEICKERYKGSVLLRSKSNTFKDKSICDARHLCGYKSKFNGLIGYYVYNEDDEEQDEYAENEIYGNV